MAVPGNITSHMSAGTNNLIRAGALAITNSSDILAALDLETTDTTFVPRADSKEEAIILELLAGGITASEELIEKTYLSTSPFAHIVSFVKSAVKSAYWNCRALGHT